MSTLEPTISKSHLVILAPVFNDWDCARAYIDRVGQAQGLPRDFRLVLIDDGSTEPMPGLETWVVPEGLTLEVIQLGTNLGHQKAIAVGLVSLADRGGVDTVIVADVDGEDLPEDCAQLWRMHFERPGQVVVAQRAKRTESTRFRVFYRVYRGVFRALTGHQLDFGNFCLIPGDVARRIVLMSSLWSHFPATLMRSRIPITKVPLDRGQRFSGTSRMNFISLVNHGLAGIAAFADVVYTRLLIFAAWVAGLLSVVVAGGVIIRLVTGSALPGWLALVAAVSILSLIQIGSTLLVMSFLTIAVGTNMSSSPKLIASNFITRSFVVPARQHPGSVDDQRL